MTKEQGDELQIGCRIILSPGALSLVSEESERLFLKQGNLKIVSIMREPESYDSRYNTWINLEMEESAGLVTFKYSDIEPMLQLDILKGEEMEVQNYKEVAPRKAIFIAYRPELARPFEVVKASYVKDFLSDKKYMTSFFAFGAAIQKYEAYQEWHNSWNKSSKSPVILINKESREEYRIESSHFNDQIGIQKYYPTDFKGDKDETVIMETLQGLFECYLTLNEKPFGQLIDQLIN